MSQVARMSGFQASQELSQSLIPQTELEAELADYQHMPDQLTPKVDVFPLLASAAKKYLTVQATSCAVERTFSISGNVVTSKRILLMTRNVEMLVNIKENLPKIDLSKVAEESPEEKDEEEEARRHPQNESELPLEF